MTIELPTWAATTPLLVLLVTALLLFIIDSLRPNRTDRLAIVTVSAVGTAVSSSVAAWFLWEGTGRIDGAIYLFWDQMVIDGMTLFFTVLVTMVAVLVILGSAEYMADNPHQGEYYTLVVLATTGMALMASANSLVMVFIALELASLPSYALVASLKQNRGSVEAGLKYFLIGAFSSAIFLYGISLVYVSTGALLLADISAALGETENIAILGVGVVLMIGGFTYKTGSVPLHFWAPDTYEGAPAPISGFISSASKAAGFVIAFRVLIEAFPLEVMTDLGIEWVVLVQVLAVVTMLLGNIAAAVQENVKRMLAYSSIGHAGYILIGLAALTNPGSTNDLVLGAAMMHLFVYGVMNTGAFLFVALAEQWDVGRTFSDYNGLWRDAPIACTAVTIFVLSLAGLPIGGGFLSKYFLFTGAIGAGFWWLAAVGAAMSALSLFYYARLVKAIWIESPPESRSINRRPTGLYVAIVVAAVFTVVLLPGFPPVAELAQSAAAGLLS